ncbi:MAG: iron-sulfur cluster assembly scaffold protein [Candidatus Aenigmatarchaeota archaeon]|nr:MAG: iron-sulfur cluster assembly scaffold protein [Candidatus Aenigmarchaeota archaeon]
MMEYGYSEKVLDVFKNPHNIGEIKDADAIGKVGNPACGDLLWMFLKIGKGRHVIEDAKVKTFGCVAAIATSSILTDMIKGKTLEDALRISKQDVVSELNGLPRQKVHCSVLAVDALKEAAYDYYTRSGISVPEDVKRAHEHNSIVAERIEHME